MTVEQKILCQAIKSAFGVSYTGTTDAELDAFIKKWRPRLELTNNILNLQVQMSKSNDGPEFD